MNFLKTFLFLSIASALSSCAEVTRSDLSITNGQKMLEGSEPSIVKLSTETHTCTGTFIRHNILITAAHCLVDESSVRANVGSRSITSLKIITNSLYDAEVRSTDLALVMFPNNTAVATTALCEFQPRRRDSVTMVGFGYNGWDNVATGGPKRAGTNEIESVRNGLITTTGLSQPLNNDGRDVTVSPGDSGGPLLHTAEHCILGIASGSSQTESVYANAVSPGFDWVDYLVARSDLYETIGADPENLLRSFTRNSMGEENEVEIEGRTRLDSPFGFE